MYYICIIYLSLLNFDFYFYKSGGKGGLPEVILEPRYGRGRVEAKWAKRREDYSRQRKIHMQRFSSWGRKYGENKGLMRPSFPNIGLLPVDWNYGHQSSQLSSIQWWPESNCVSLSCPKFKNFREGLWWTLLGKGNGKAGRLGCLVWGSMLVCPDPIQW